jgi:protocatechuate 3,4-dioxygenase beta subunit
MTRQRSAFLLSILVLASASLAAATTGALVDRDGRPVAGATVRALPFETEEALASRLASLDPPPEALAAATSDSRGRFSLDIDVPYFRVAVEADGFAPVVDRAERNELMGALLLEPAERVTITVEGEGKPVPGALVIANGQEARTGDEGKASIVLPKEGFTTLVVRHPDWAPYTRSSARASQLPKTISLSRGVAVRGSVETAAGEPVAGAAISVDGNRLAASADDGTFVVAHAPSAWKQLTASRGDDIAIASRSSAAGYRMRLTRGAAISGTVIDGKTQAPIAHAPVDLVEERPGVFTRRDGLVPRALTDAKGRFRIAPVIPGTYSIAASRLGYEFSPVPVEVKTGERIDRSVSGQPLARVSGTVLTEERKPIGAAAVRPREEDLRRQMTRMAVSGGPPPSPARFLAASRPAWSSADGEWVLREAPVDREVILEASRPGLPRGESDTLRLAARERKEKVAIVIPRGITVTGRVTTRDRLPLANAMVEARTRDAGQGPQVIVRRIGAVDASEGVRTGSDGAFTMQLAAGTYDLIADADGYAPETSRAVEIRGEVEPITFELGEAVTVSGRVVRADGSGVPDVNVAPISSSSSSVMTGPDGSFIIEELPRGPVTLMALKAADYIREMASVEAPASNVEIKIPAGGTVRGRVLEKGSKKPVTDFRVGPSGERRGAGMRMIGPTNLQPIRSDDGSFELMNVPVGPTEIVAEAAGYVTATTTATVEEGKATEEITILLEPGTRVFGRVSSPEGTPLTGASVSLVSGEDDALPMIARRSATATTDANGEYTISGVAPGARSFRATHESYPLVTKDANVSGREQRLDLQFPRGTDVTGVVVREGGSPVAGAQVAASTTQQGAGGKAATTDANGNFRIEGLTPGRYNFSVRSEGATETLRDVDIATSGPLRIELKAAGVVTGRVVGLDPSEISNATVNANTSSAYSSAPVRSDGTYRIEGAPTGTVRVFASAGTFERRRTTTPKVVEVTAGSEAFVDLEFTRGNRVTGRVTRGGAPVDGANVSFQPKGGTPVPQVASARSASDGSYSVEGLEDGAYTVFVMDGRTFSSHFTEYEVRGGGTFDIQMSSASIRGRVVDRQTQEGIPGVSVALDVTDQARYRLPPMQTDASGAFRIDGISSGNHRLRATKNGYGHEVTDVVVSGDGEQDIEIRMSRSDGVQLRVVDRRDGRALRAFVSVADMGGRLALEEMLSDANDSISLAPGAYRAAVSVGGYAPTVIDIRSPGGPYVVALTPGGSLRIDSTSAERRRARIIDSSGRPVIRGRITVPSEMTIDAAGATVTGMEAGSYTLEILDSAGGVANRHPFTITEGQTTTIRI